MSGLNPAPKQRRVRLGRGISLVELMVGIAVGLMVVAAATTVVTAQLGSTRLVLLETQVDQDLRTAAEVVNRELRRSGASVIFSDSLWYQVGQLQLSATNYSLPSLTSGDASSIDISYRRGPGEEYFGFKLENDTIKILVSDGGPGVWQELTDPATLKVTRFSIATVRAGDRARSDNLKERRVACPYLCADGTPDCWPKVTSLEFTLEIEGESLRDSAVRRTISTSVAGRTLFSEFESVRGPDPALFQSCPGLPN
jgi:type II secretory pathway component PulJ